MAAHMLKKKSDNFPVWKALVEFLNLGVFIPSIPRSIAAYACEHRRHDLLVSELIVAHDDEINAVRIHRSEAPFRKTAEKSEKAPRKAKKDPKAPKRALSAYMFFSSDWRERIRAENPEAGFGEIGKLLGAKWKELDDEEKKPYVEQAAKDKERAEDEKTAYDNKKNSAGSGGSGAEEAGNDEEDDD
ncbi:high mobility group box domain-containing protein [Rhodocollybia butyracea]|uniref:High mobility group box domain-containing protein n=1 Tax=Rhodocollybia butyracea TaxID=206335 RepID=A0A9P5Q5D0_9AGAR|nr:high mobility group box domain-containing protein [Rhodocollybia butyracea]